MSRTIFILILIFSQVGLAKDHQAVLQQILQEQFQRIEAPRDKQSVLDTTVDLQKRTMVVGGGATAIIAALLVVSAARNFPRPVILKIGSVSTAGAAAAKAEARAALEWRARQTLYLFRKAYTVGLSDKDSKEAVHFDSH